MKKSTLIKAILDGLIQSIILVCLGSFSISVYASNLSLNHFLLIGVLGAFLSSAIFVALMRTESDNNTLVCLTAVGSFCFILNNVFFFAADLSFILPLRETNNADGILILCAIGCYILASFILRACVFAVFIIKNQRRKQQKQHITGE